VDILQVNLGYRRNMACKHCHAQAGPGRTEIMPPETVRDVLGVLGENSIGTLDLTGGAPEWHPMFREIVEGARALDRHVTVRSNLTVVFEPGMEDVLEFYATSGVEVIASLPYYLAENVDRVRGAGTFEKSLKAMRRLNDLGYGKDGSGRVLNLVFNPHGAYLPPSQSALEEEYRRMLEVRHGIVFNHLYTFTNMPIGRFNEFLVRSGNQQRYMNRLLDAFNPETLQAVMCRSLISVDWRGWLYDCDFNQVEDIPVGAEYPRHLRDFEMDRLATRMISIAEHCYGCTAGQGSS